MALPSRLARPASSSPGFVCASCQTRVAAARSRFSSTSSSTSTASRAAAAAAPPPPPSSGLIALSSRRLLSISGPDAPKFLQGVITQNILAPQAGSASTAHKIRTDGFYGAFLTATGRVLYDVFIYPDTRSSLNPTATTTTATAAAPGESFLVEVDADEAARLERHIKRYKLRAKFTVRLLDRREATVWHAWDEDGRAALDATAGQGVEDYHRLVHMRDPRAPGLGWRMVKAGDREPLVDLARVAAGGDKEEEDVYRVRRYLLGVPEGQKELLRETALPLEGNLDVMGGIDFRKGCYVGQELTIRTKHRGVVRKRVLPVVVYGAEEEEEEEEEEEAAPQALEYRAGGPVDASSIPVDTSIGRLEKKGRSAGKWLRGVGNVGLALCRLEIMTDVVLPGETAAASYNPAGEFVMETQPGEDGEGGASKVKIKAFVPDWLRQRLDEQNSGHGQP